jgi:hypothetical protein
MRLAVATLMTILVACSGGESSKKNNSENGSMAKDCEANAEVANKSFEMRNGKTSGEEEFEFVGMVYAQNMKAAIFPPLKMTQKSCSGTFIGLSARVKISTKCLRKHRKSPIKKDEKNFIWKRKKLLCEMYQ